MMLSFMPIQKHLIKKSYVPVVVVVSISTHFPLGKRSISGIHIAETPHFIWKQASKTKICKQ